MTTNTELIERIDMDTLLKMSRYAGGHDEQMQALFKDSIVIAHWNEGDYQGSVATIVQLNDTHEYITYEDYYGSCSGCDAWEDASNEDVKRMCIQLASTAHIFSTKKDLLSFLNEDKYADNFSRKSKHGLLKELKKKAEQ